MKMKSNSSVSTSYFFFLITILFLSVNFLSIAETNPDKLAEKARNIIDRYYYADDFHVNVDNNDVLTIDGTVNTLYDKLRVRELLSRIPGLKQINSKIEVNPSMLPDKEIEMNIRDELGYNKSILEPENIKINVKDGVVTLSGTVSHYREKLMAQSIASWQDGVKDMISNIKVLSPAAAKSDANIYDIVNDVLKDHFPLEKNVVADVNDGIVTVSGSVRNLWAKEHITDELLQIAGVNDVNNDLVILPPESI